MKMKSKRIRIRIVTVAVFVMLLATSVNAAWGDQKSLSRAKNYLLDKVEKAIGYIGDMKSRVDSVKELTDEEKGGIKSRFDAYIHLFEEGKTRISAAETRQDLIFIVGDMRQTWGELTNYRDSIRGIVFTSKFEGVLVRARKLSDRIDTKISELKAGGVDTTKLEEYKIEFNGEIELAEDKVSDARGKFESGETREGYDLLGEAKKSLEEAYKILKDMVVEFRKRQGG